MVRKTQDAFTPQTPGEVLKKYIVDAKGITQDQLARAMEVSRLTVNQLVNGKRSVTAEMSLRLARVLGTTPDFWLNLQREVDLFEAKKKLASKIESLTVLRRGDASATQ
jgi:addiction module HigA family antidote